jgi:hypothetical protein
MISNELLINMIILSLIAIVFGCILGLTITHIIDRRLGEISITLPKVVVSGKNVYEPFSDVPKVEPDLGEAVTTCNVEPVKVEPLKVQPLKVQPLKVQPLKVQPLKVQPPKVQPPKVQPVNLEPVEVNPPTDSPSRVLGCNVDKDCNVVNGNGENKCLSTHKCYCVKGSGAFCHYGPTYYKDPKDLTSDQIRKFKFRAKVYKMTSQDYVNWLHLFEDKDDQNLLAPRHLANLQRLLKGIPITDADVPREEIPPPMTSEQYFNQLYQLDTQLNPQNSDMAGVQLPANYFEYSQFDNPRNLKHLDDYNHKESLNKYQNREVLNTTQWKISHDYKN